MPRQKTVEELEKIKNSKVGKLLNLSDAISGSRRA